VTPQPSKPQPKPDWLCRDYVGHWNREGKWIAGGPIPGCTGFGVTPGSATKDPFPCSCTARRGMYVRKWWDTCKKVDYCDCACADSR
jgi:hypothetical protein